MQNAGLSSVRGTEWFYAETVSPNFRYNVNVNFYQNTFDAFVANYVYPRVGTVQNMQQQINSGSLKLNTFFKANGWDVQASVSYLAPDLIPQGRIEERYGMDLGLSKKFSKGKNEVFLNATDLFNTMVISKTIQSGDLKYTSKDYYETQVVRIGFSRKI
jgi:hypothetical protein